MRKTKECDDLNTQMERTSSGLYEETQFLPLENHYSVQNGAQYGNKVLHRHAHNCPKMGQHQLWGET